MNDGLAEMALQAEAAWQQGRQQAEAGRLDAAYGHYRQAHDLVVSCPKLHQKAHRRLLGLNLRRRAYREALIDMALLGLGPLWSFEVVAYLLTRRVLGGDICKRT